MFSSATVATSASRCCTSRSVGCAMWLYRYATTISNGVIASAMSASCHEKKKRTIVTETIVSTFWKKKMSP